MQPWTVRVAKWSARRRWLVFPLWFVATLGLFALSLQAGGTKTLDVNSDASVRARVRGVPHITIERL